MIPYNFHSHSSFSDGSHKPEEYVQEAIRLEMKGYGFSEHAPLPFDTVFSLKASNEVAYRDEIVRLKDLYHDSIDIFLALEADYIPGISEPLQSLKSRLELDYLIASVHLVKGNEPTDKLWFTDGPKHEIYDEGIMQIFNGDAKKAVTAYWHQIIQMLEEETFDVVGHIDKIKMHNKDRWFKETDNWYIALVDKAIDLIQQKDLLVEVNTRGIYKGRSASLFPGREILDKFLKKKIRIVLSSDAHHPSEINKYFDETVAELKVYGFKSVWIYTYAGWEELPFSELPS